MQIKELSIILKCHNDYLQYDEDKGKNYVKDCIEGQHLYILSNDKIKEDDTYVERVSTDICSIKNSLGLNFKQLIVINSTGLCKKILASTDKSLNLPDIPEYFIKQYCESNGNIKEIEVEYEKAVSLKISTATTKNEYKIIQPKLNNNTIIIN